MLIRQLAENISQIVAMRYDTSISEVLNMTGLKMNERRFALGIEAASFFVILSGVEE